MLKTFGIVFLLNLFSTEIAFSQEKKQRQKNIVTEGKATNKDKNKINFEETDIAGARKSPLGTLINQNKADKEYDFIKIRLKWHDEMVQSATGLESGRSQ